MFDIGFWEIALILVLALVVLGPERLPGAAKKVGYWVGKGRRYIEGVKNEVSKELDSTELKRLLHNQSVQLEELKNQVNRTTHDVNDDMQNVLDRKSTRLNSSHITISYAGFCLKKKKHKKKKTTPTHHEL